LEKGVYLQLFLVASNDGSCFIDFISSTEPPPQMNDVSTPDSLTDDFNTLITSTVSLLENCTNKLELCKQACCNLTISDNSDVLLFGNKKLTEIRHCVSFQQLFDTIQKHYSWKEFSLLKVIISNSNSVEARIVLEQFEQSMCSAAVYSMNLISDSLPPGDLLPEYVKLHVKIDTPSKKLTLEGFQKVRDFIFKYLDIKLFVALPFIKFYFGSLHLEWYVPERAIPYITEGANDADDILAKHSVAFIKLSDKVIYDPQGRTSIEKPLKVC